MGHVEVIALPTQLSTEISSRRGLVIQRSQNGQGRLLIWIGSERLRARLKISLMVVEALVV